MGMNKSPLWAMACASLLTIAAPPATAATATATAAADRIWTGGPILTMNDAAMRAEAIAEQGGRIVAVGSKAEVMKLKGRKTQVLDLGGRALLPGFVDAHGHLTGGGLQALSANLLAPPDGDVTDLASLQRTLREWIAANPQIVREVNLVVGFGYDQAMLAEQRHPTRDDLDAVSKDVPILLVHQSGHISALNSKALEVVGINAASVDPPGGVIRRRAGSREPDGVLEESAHFPAATQLVMQVGRRGALTMVRAGAELWARFGYTTADEGRASAASVAMLRQVGGTGGLKLDVVAYPDVLTDRETIKAGYGKPYESRVRIGGAKLTIDGSPQGFTAWRDRPYYKPVGDYPAGYRGYTAVTPGQVTEAVDWAYANGTQILVHANGESALDLMNAAVTLAQMKHPDAKDLRPVLIHGQFLREDQVDTLDRLGILPSLFPMHTFYWGDWHVNQTVGPEIGQNISPTGWVRARGMRFTSHHDAPVAFPDSMRVLSATVTRKARGSGQVIGPQQRVDVITALKAMTIWPAWQHREESSKGSLEPGKLADFVVLSADPTAVAPETLEQLKVVETIKEGATIYKLTAAAQKKAALAYRPALDGRDPFMQALRGLAVEREFAALPPWSRTPRMRAGIEARSHDAACVMPVVDDLLRGMLVTERQASLIGRR
jgi:predicted amidohydrolase YtcJ